MTGSVEWPPSVEGSPDERDAKLKDLLATIDPKEEGFALHEHYVFDRTQASTTVSVPWSDFRLTVGTTDDIEARRAFGKAYLAHVATAPEEMAALKNAMLASGHVPLSDRL